MCTFESTVFSLYFQYECPVLIEENLDPKLIFLKNNQKNPEKRDLRLEPWP